MPCQARQLHSPTTYVSPKLGLTRKIHARESSQETRTFARMIASVIEEAEAINWYEQRISVEKDQDAIAIMKDAQGEEFKHFGMDLEFLLRRKPKWKGILQGILFKDGNVVKLGEAAEKANG